jgi:hypothetical protein
MAKVKFKPKSLLGKLSIGIIILMPLYFYLLTKFTSDLIIEGGIIYGIAAFFCGIIGIIRKKDYSVFVILSTLLGLFVLLYCLQIVLFPGLIDYT